MQWRCDYCLVASFPTFEAASQHELTCPARLAQIDRGGGAARPPGVSSHVNVIEDRSRSPSPANESQPATSDTVKDSEVVEERPATLWECDICNEYKSHNYQDVVMHEKTCVAVDSTGGDEAMDESDGIGKEEKKKKDRSNKSPKRTRWRCDVCSIKTFDTYEEAVEHEKTCTGAKEGDEIKRKTKRSKKEDQGSAIKAPKSHDDSKASTLAICKPDVESLPIPVSATIRSDSKTTQPVATEKVQVMPPKKSQTKSNSNEARLVDSLVVRTREMDALKASSALDKNITKEETPQCVESMDQSRKSNDITLQCVESSMNHSKESNDDESPTNPSIVKSILAFIIKATIFLAPFALAFIHLPRNLHDNLGSLTTLPSFAVMAASPLILTTAAYSMFSLALVVTHQGVHHHKSRGFIIDILMAVRDTVSPPKVDYLNWDEPCPTLREYLNHPDGFCMAFAPAFFGFFAYFGALIALEEETSGKIVPKINGECGLKSVSGASAGAMAAVMLASGIQPRVAAEYVSKFSWGMVADPPGLFGLVKGNKFEEFMRSFIKEAATRTEEMEGDVMLEDALVPVAVSGFDLRSLRGTILSRGCMAKAARASAGFPGLFQPVSWEEGDSKELLIDGGIRDGLGLNGLSAVVSSKMRIINVAVGDFGISGPNGLDDLPTNINADSLVSIAIVNTPMCGPWAMANGPRAVESAYKAMASMLDTPMERGKSINHYTLRVDASKWLE
eukprot:scaffold377712_cov76-Cyclotella_meneghiniana.AAC.1